jgi:uncharacterized protein
MKNVDTVKHIYEAFGRGDIPTIMEMLDDDVEWDVDSRTPGVPWLEPRRGKKNVPAFFESLKQLNFPRFEPHAFFANESGDEVFSLIRMEVVQSPSGKHYDFPNEGHFWRFNDKGKVVKYEHVTDTLLHQRMARGQ